MRSFARSLAVPEAPAEPLDRRRPTLSGDLREMFRHAPVFRRRPIGYDRFQVDTYVRWAEEEIAAAGHEREVVLQRHARLRADLDEARRLLCHTASGRESVQLARRLGAVLAAAADEADGMRADGEAARTRAEAEAERIRAEATAEAERIRAEAEAEAGRLAAEAEQVMQEAEQVMQEARAEAEARLAKACDMERMTAERAERLREAAAREAETARSQARDEVLRMLASAREDRRRGEERRAALQAELAALQQRVADDVRPVPVPAPREVEPVTVGVPDAGRAVPFAHLGRRLRRS